MDAEGFFAAIEEAVTDFADSLDAIDRDFQSRTWDEVPEGDAGFVDFVWELDAAILGDYADAWDTFIETLEGMRPPEGVAGAGGGFEEGLPEYFDRGIIAAERSALTALRAWVEARLSLSTDERLAFAELGGERALSDDERDRQLAVTDEFYEALRDVDDEWELFGESAEAVGSPIADAVDLRSDMRLTPLRANRASQPIRDLVSGATVDGT